MAESQEGRALPPIPSSVSEQARRFLATDLKAMQDDFPAVDDVDGWLAFVDKANSRITERFAGVELPVAVEDMWVGDVCTYVIRGPEVTGDDGPVYLDIHGGALVFGAGELCRLMGGAVAMTTGMTTWVVDYRMPPLHPYPTPLDDCVAVYRRLLDVRSPQDVFVGGSSAGGNLAAALLVRAKDEGLPMPAGLLLMTPECDLTESGDSFETNLGVDNVLGKLMPVNLLYANGHDLAHPYLSPLFADLSGFPPTFLQTGTRDLFLSNTVRMHRALLGAGVEAELHVWEAMPHAGFGGMTPEDMEMRGAMRRFLDRHRP